MKRTEVAVTKTRRWFNRWQIPIGTAFVAIAATCAGGIVVHYIDMYDVIKMRKSTQLMMDKKDMIIVDLAKQAGAAAKNASLAAQSATKATQKASKAVEESSDAAEKANEAVQTANDMRTKGIEKWQR